MPYLDDRTLRPDTTNNHTYTYDSPAAKANLAFQAISSAVAPATSVTYTGQLTLPSATLIDLSTSPLPIPVSITWILHTTHTIILHNPLALSIPRTTTDFFPNLSTLKVNLGSVTCKPGVEVGKSLAGKYDEQIMTEVEGLMWEVYNEDIREAKLECEPPMPGVDVVSVLEFLEDGRRVEMEVDSDRREVVRREIRGGLAVLHGREPAVICTRLEIQGQTQ